MHLGIRAEGLAVVVTLYGSDLVTDPDEMGNLRTNGPVLGVFGEKDGTIPQREIEAFRAGLVSLGVDTTITVYPGVGHAFVKSSTYRDDGSAGQARKQVVEFLKQALR